jgi:hypothetical protein
LGPLPQVRGGQGFAAGAPGGWLHRGRASVAREHRSPDPEPVRRAARWRPRGRPPPSPLRSKPLRTTRTGAPTIPTAEVEKFAEVDERRPASLLYTRGTGSGENSWVDLPDGTRRRLTKQESDDPSLLPDGHRFFIPDNLTSADVTATGTFEYEFDGMKFLPRGGHWSSATERSLSRDAGATAGYPTIPAEPKLR